APTASNAILSGSRLLFSPLRRFPLRGQAHPAAQIRLSGLVWGTPLVRAASRTAFFSRKSRRVYPEGSSQVNCGSLQIACCPE
ncbi:MAG: hypothetical protein JXA97_14225, partial [Anaerolineales bacterium]|nr:hypothetical protein [Anaerolineales bacterium]